MDLTTRNTRIEETCKLVFFVYSILASPKHVSCFFFFLIFFMRGIYNQSQPDVCPHFFVFFEAHIMYSLHCRCPLTVDKTKHWNTQKMFTFCRMCGRWFHFCFSSVFVSAVWTWHRHSRKAVGVASGHHLLDVHILHGGRLHCTLCVASVNKTHSIL